MALWLPAQLRLQYQVAKGRGLTALLVSGAQTWGLEPGYVLAVASRETGVREYGCRLLRGNVNWARGEWPDYTPEQWKKLAASAYNAGRGGARGAWGGS